VREQELAMPAARVAARAAAAPRRGDVGAGQREDGERRHGCWGGTWHGLERRGGGRCAAHGRRGRRQSGAEKTEEEGAGGRRWGLICYFPKVQGLLCNAR
jgi:hypothetical protein